MRVKSKQESRCGRKEIAKTISHMEGLSEAQSERIVQLIIDQIILALLNGSVVYLPKLGKLVATYMKERSCKHPRTHALMTAKPSIRLKFEAANPVRRLLNERVEELKEKTLPSIAPAPTLPTEEENPAA